MKIDAVDSTTATRRLKIAVLNRIFSVAGGGAERYSVAVVEQLAAEHEVHVFAQEIRHEWSGVHYHRISCISKKPRWLNQLWYAWATRRATQTGFDIVHSHENVWHGNVQTIHVKTVKRSLLEDRAGWRLALRWFKIALSPRLISYMALEARRMSPREGVAIVAVSKNLQDELIAQYPGATPHVSVITPGVNLPASVMTREQARIKLGVPVDGQYVLFVANDYARKGLPSLLNALGPMHGVRVLVVGHPGQIERFKAVAVGLGLQDQVFFLGSLQDMSPAYLAVDVLAHPTLEDSFAMAVIEAMAHGVPVVVSGPAYCGITSLLSDKLNALVLDNPLDAAALRQLLSHVLDNQDIAKALAEEGKLFALEHSWQRVGQEYEALYLRITKPAH
jgi:glycosyltransferase involved in cell wall biosynthesis